jgi:hypothetical protein
MFLRPLPACACWLLSAFMTYEVGMHVQTHFRTFWRSADSRHPISIVAYNVNIPSFLMMVSHYLPFPNTKLVQCLENDVCDSCLRQTVYVNGAINFLPCTRETTGLKLLHYRPFLLTYGAEPFFRSCQLCSHSRTSQHFMEPEGSSPYSQEPSTGPYPKPDRSSPYHPILSKIYFNTVLPPTSWYS